MFPEASINISLSPSPTSTAPITHSLFVVSSKNSVCDYSFQTRADPDEHKATIFAAEPSVRPIQRKRRDERKGEENGEEGREGKETDRKLLTKTTQVEEMDRKKE
ncbi:hypothetical protein ABKV19_026901 [Rosa sericea]